MGAWHHILEYVSPHSSNGSLLFGVGMLGEHAANQQKMQWNEREGGERFVFDCRFDAGCARPNNMLCPKNAVNFKMDIQYPLMWQIEMPHNRNCSLPIEIFGFRSCWHCTNNECIHRSTFAAASPGSHTVGARRKEDNGAWTIDSHRRRSELCTAIECNKRKLSKVWSKTGRPIGQ